MNRFRLPWGVIVGVWLTSAISGVDAQVSTQEGASVVVFPKVVVDGTWDTTIQLGNAANRPTHAVCHYVNAQLLSPDQPPGPLNAPQWTDIEFTVDLLKLQPTHWVVSRGRAVDTTEPCTPASTDCDAAWAAIGRVPEVPDDFIGELLCIEVDASGAPWTGNGLIGEATLTHRSSGEVVKFPAVGLAGFDTNNGDGRLCLGGEASEGCSLGAEYAPCPRSWIASHPSNFDDRDVDRDASSTRLTVVPCSQDFDTNTPGTVTLSFQLISELEQLFSVSTSVQCWADFDVGEANNIFNRDLIGGDWLQTKVRVVNGDGGIMVVQQNVRQNARPPTFTAVASTAHQDGTGEEADFIVLPEVAR